MCFARMHAMHDAFSQTLLLFSPVVTSRCGRGSTSSGNCCHPGRQQQKAHFGRLDRWGRWRSNRDATRASARAAVSFLPQARTPIWGVQYSYSLLQKIISALQSFASLLRPQIIRGLSHSEPSFATHSLRACWLQHCTRICYLGTSALVQPQQCSATKTPRACACVVQQRAQQPTRRRRRRNAAVAPGPPINSTQQP